MGADYRLFKEVLQRTFCIIIFKHTTCNPYSGVKEALYITTISTVGILLYQGLMDCAEQKLF